MKTFLIFQAVVCLIATFLLSCNKNTPAQQVTGNYYYPPVRGDEWETETPSALGWDEQKLRDVIDFVARNNSTAFVILYKGKIVTETYWGGYSASSTDRIFSASKSMGAFLVGLAEEQGKLQINQTVTNYLGAGWSNASLNEESKITIKHLLTMTSGLTENLRFRESAGSHWFYNTPAYHKIYDVLSSVYKQTNNGYTSDQLWSKIGMQNSSWVSDSDGGLSMKCSARDMARFGLMILSDGSWNGSVLMQNKDYFQAMLHSGQVYNPAYGYLWWLNGKSSYILPTSQNVTGPIMPDAPPDLVAALGHGDKKIYVSKSRDLVVIRHGLASNYPVQLAVSSFDNELWKRLMFAIR